MWTVVGTLKPTHKINTYLAAFRTAVAYENSNKFFRFLCSKVGLMGHMALFRFARRYKTKLVRHKINTIIVSGIKHQL